MADVLVFDITINEKFRGFKTKRYLFKGNILVFRRILKWSLVKQFIFSDISIPNWKSHTALTVASRAAIFVFWLNFAEDLNQGTSNAFTWLEGSYWSKKHTHSKINIFFNELLILLPNGSIHFYTLFFVEINFVIFYLYKSWYYHLNNWLSGSPKYVTRYSFIVSLTFFPPCVFFHSLSVSSVMLL